MTEHPASSLWRVVDAEHPDSLALLVETPQGPHLRRIPPALPLPAHIPDHGAGAEAAVHTAAATWGLPEFVFRQKTYASKGSGRRELGDRLLLAGGRGAVVQVKARTIPPKQEPEEANWIQKVAAKAMRQAKGTVRQLRMAPAEMVNGRDRTMTVDGNAYEWVSVFLLDHPRVPEDTVVTWEPTGTPAIALTRRDWDFLFNQLRSTTAVLDYLFRAAAVPATALGQEAVRYYEFAAADVAHPPGEMDTELVGPAGVLYSVPQLPQAPAGADGTNTHLMIRIVLEDVALSPLTADMTEGDRFILLSDLDRLPVAARAEWGGLLLDMLRDVPRVPEEHFKWHFRRMLSTDGTTQLIVGAGTRFDSTVQSAWRDYVRLRHHEVTARTGETERASTLGVLLTPRHDGLRPWDSTTVRVNGDLQMTEEELQISDRLWNRSTTAGTHDFEEDNADRETA